MNPLKKKRKRSLSKALALETQKKKCLPFLLHSLFSTVTEAISNREKVAYKEIQEMPSVLQDVLQLWMQLRHLPFLLSALVTSPDPRLFVLAQMTTLPRSFFDPPCLFPL